MKIIAKATNNNLSIRLLIYAIFFSPADSVPLLLFSPRLKLKCIPSVFTAFLCGFSGTFNCLDVLFIVHNEGSFFKLMIAKTGNTNIICRMIAEIYIRKIGYLGIFLFFIIGLKKVKSLVWKRGEVFYRQCRKQRAKFIP